VPPYPVSSAENGTLDEYHLLAQSHSPGELDVTSATKYLKEASHRLRNSSGSRLA
jgi:hypothetical protein